jgi:NAD(P) transhydrogenase subunit alpha
VKIAIARETRLDEQRVSMTPDTVSRLMTLGAQVVVETKAGLGAGYDDGAYRAMGAVIAKNKTALYQKVDIVSWVKRPENNIERLLPIPPKAIIVGFLDSFKPGDHIQYFAQKGFTTLSWDLLPHKKETEHIDASAAMGRHAGRIACLNALKTAGSKMRQPQRLTVLIIGSGNAGLAAAQHARQMGNTVIVASTRLSSKQYIEESLSVEFVLLPQVSPQSMPVSESQQRELLRQVILQRKPDIIITTARRFRQKPPLIITEQELDMMKPGTVIEDLTATTGGNTTYSQVDEEVMVQNGILIRNKSNYPSQEPKSASESYSQCLWHLLKHIMTQTREKPDYALNKDPLLGAVVATYQGHLGPSLLRHIIR